MLRHYKGKGSQQPRGIRKGAHPRRWAAHLYCIGDETLIRKLVEKAARLLLE